MNVSGRRRGYAFTLIELLVVVAIIALLISILLPSLQRARDQAKAVKCGANMHSVGLAVATYVSEDGAKFPASYQYLDGNGAISFDPGGGSGGYLHWSHALWNGGQVGREAFECPSFQNRGNPRTNPGMDGADWESNQVDQNSQSSPNPRTDLQAPRMAYTANAAIMPRNKWTSEMSGGPRLNRFVRETELKGASDIILLTEFNRNWIAAARAQGGNYLSKSHRPVNPFWHSASGYDEYGSDRQGFRYGRIGDDTYGLRPLDVIENAPGLIEGTQGSELNAVGRHHPGGDKLGGSADFLYSDGHVERKTVLQTMQQREWGERYYGVTGDNKVVDRYGELP